jgi:hypothetical protein
MNDRISEIFGYIVLVAAIVLFTWEYRTFAQREEDDTWLLTARRFRRRSLVAMILVLIGIMIVLESRKIINLHQLAALWFYVSSLTGLAVLLLVLAAVDLADTAKNATRQAMQEFESAVETEKRRLQLDTEQEKRS